MEKFVLFSNWGGKGGQQGLLPRDPKRVFKKPNMALKFWKILKKKTYRRRGIVQRKIFPTSNLLAITGGQTWLIFHES